MARYMRARRVVRRSRQATEKRRKIMLIAGGAAALLLLVVLLFSIFHHPTFVAAQGSMTFSVNAGGIVIRSERLYKAENSGKTEFLAMEGQVVNAGVAIADVYSWDYNESDYFALKELREKIMDYQQNNALSDVVDEELQALDALIGEKTQEIKGLVTGEEEGDINVLQAELASLMSERSTVLKDAAKQDTQLTSYYEEEQTLETRISNYKTTIAAEYDGVVSFYFDGLEAILTPANMEKLTVKDIDRIYNGTYLKSASQTGVRPLYRLVDNNLWYVVMVSKEAIAEFENDTAFKVEFSFGEDYTYSATVEDSQKEGKKYIYYLKFTESIDKLLLARQVEFTVSTKYVGIDVPESAIKKKGGEYGVYYLRNGKKTFEAVDILIKDGKRAIVRSKSLEGGLSVGSVVYE